MSWDAIEGKKETGEKIPYTKFSEGNSVIRVLDNEPFSFWNHWLQKQQTGVSCIGKDCPICAVIAQQKADKVPLTYSSSQRHAVRIWNYGTNQEEVMIQGRQFFQTLLAYHREVGDITTYDIKIIRKGGGTDTTYTMIPQPKSEIKPEIAEKIVPVDFTELFKPLEKETILMLMEGKTWEEIKALNGTEEDN